MPPPARHRDTAIATRAHPAPRHPGAPLENARLARDEYQAGAVVLESLPPIVTLALTTFCNNRIPCVICDRNVRPACADSETSPEVGRVPAQPSPVVPPLAIQLLAFSLTHVNATR